MNEGQQPRRFRAALVYTALILLTALTALVTYNAFVTAPNDRDEIEATAEKAKETSDALAKSNAGVTALICTGSNRHDSIDLAIIDEAGLSDKISEDIPPPTNCGELICQFFREIDEPGAEIVIKDPFGPDRKLEECGEAPA